MFKRLIYVIQFPIFFVYVMFPPLWLLELPYWVASGRSLWDDWWNYNE